MLDPGTASHDQYVRDDVREIAETSITLVEIFFDRILEDVKRHAHVHRLTLCGIKLVMEHARGALNEFSAGRSSSGLALNRCAYEAIVNVMIWNRHPSRAIEDMKALPILAANEQASRLGEKLIKRKGSLHRFDPLTSKLPEGVLRDLQTILAQNPEIAIPTRLKFMDEAKE